MPESNLNMPPAPPRGSGETHIVGGMTSTGTAEAIHTLRGVDRKLR
jgi:hypothetical protein